MVVVILASACSEEPPPRISLATLPVSGCVDWKGMPIERLCIPRAAKESAPLAFEAEAPCGACGAEVDRCTASIEAHDITLSLDGRSCQAAPGATCANPCGKRRVTCRLPALGPGRYTVRWADGSGHVDVLDVGMNDGATATCAFDR